MERVIVFSHLDRYLFELDSNTVTQLVLSEELNGEHSLTITTSQVLEKGERILTRDAMGKWREHVVVGEDVRHKEGKTAYGTYTCVWSIQYDLTGTFVNRMPGVQVPVSTSEALEAALSGTDRWTVGSVTSTAQAGASMYYKSGWEAMSILVWTWGGELDASIEVDNMGGVISRSADIYYQLGNQSAQRRFDYGSDVTYVRRKIDQTATPCRIIPLGSGELLDNGEYGRRIDITSVNDDVLWLQNDETAPLLRLPDGQGGYEYPTQIVVNDDIADPGELLEWARSVLEDYTTPNVTYEASVVQLSQAGMDIEGIALGDAVQCVDRQLGIRLEGRVRKLVTNLLDTTDNKVTIGSITKVITDQLGSISAKVRNLDGKVDNVASTADSATEYLDDIVANLNARINATGGFTYITEGSGIRTYDHAVSDPMVGAEATAVVEVKGGTIRIASSKDAQGVWEWRTVFESGHIAAEMVTAASISAGYIGSPSGNYWDLDAGTLQLTSGALYGSSTLGDALNAKADASALSQVESDLTVSIGGLASDFESTIGGVNADISNLAATVTAQGDDFSERIEDIEAHVKIGTNRSGQPAIVLSASGGSADGMSTELTNTALSFLDHGQVVAQVSNLALTITDANIEDMLSIGNFAWIPRSDGSMALKWIGD